MKEKKDWIGDRRSVFKGLGATAHSEGERESRDYYATEPRAVRLLLEVEKFNKNIWECACGEGHISEELKKHGYSVWSTDLVDRGYGEVKDFLFFNDTKFDGDIITNPPYRYATEFVYKALEVIPEGNKVAMFLRLLFLEGKERKKLFEQYPPKVVYVASGRLNVAKNGEFEKYNTNTAMAFAWFV